MNTIIITGNVVKVEFNEEKKFAKFPIRHSVRKADGSYTNGYLNMTAFGKVAERLSHFKQGSPLEFMAHFSFSQYEKDGKTLRSVDYVVDNFYTIHDGVFVGKKEDTDKVEE